MGRGIKLLALLSIVTLGACATPLSWDCHYDSTKGSSMTCSYLGREKFSTEVLPPIIPAKEEVE